MKRPTATQAFERAIRERCDRLRETAEQLKAGKINQYHAANRITKIANEIAGARA